MSEFDHLPGEEREQHWLQERLATLSARESVALTAATLRSPPQNAVDAIKEFYIFRTVRPNSMSQKAGSEYVEVLITNYDPRDFPSQCSIFGHPDSGSGARYELIHEPEAA